MTDTRFNDEEVSLILRRALEADTGGRDGLTLGQLKEIAGEVGIDPLRIESAALAVQADRQPAGGRFLGSRMSTRYDVEVRGDMDDDGYAEVIRLIRGAMGRQGVVTEAFGAVEWKARDFFGGRYVTIRSQNGRTRVEGLGNFRDGAMVSAGMGGTAGLAASAVLLKATVGGVAGLGILGPAALLVGAVVPSYALYRRWFVKEDAALRSAVTDIAARIGSPADDGDPETPQG
jgi:hypothetical protein